MPNSSFLTDSHQGSAPAAGLGPGSRASLRCPPAAPVGEGGR
jgi:hypothetical protein